MFGEDLSSLVEVGSSTKGGGGEFESVCEG